jgi:hypothetical protein
MLYGGFIRIKRVTFSHKVIGFEVENGPRIPLLPNFRAAFGQRPFPPKATEFILSSNSSIDFLSFAFIMCSPRRVQVS